MSLIPENARSGSSRELAPVGLEQLVPPIRRTPEGTIDFDHYLVRARTLRATAFGQALRAITLGVRRAAAGVLATIRAHNAHRRAVAELRSLDDRTLRDLGLSRTGLDYIVDHGREDVPTPANTNSPVPQKSTAA
jgi:uncharacterized protein YjiS (DUF1127 family)